jgi:hypothetical protein
MDGGFEVREYRKRVISGYRREAAKHCALLGYYTASSGNFLPLLAA